MNARLADLQWGVAFWQRKLFCERERELEAADFSEQVTLAPNDTDAETICRRWLRMYDRLNTEKNTWKP